MAYQMRWKESQFEHNMCDDLIELARNGKTIVQCCAGLGISKTTYYKYLERHPLFKEAHDYARTLAQAAREEIGEAGELGIIDKFSAPTYMFHMKNQFRADYATVEEKETNARVDAFKEIADLVKAVSKSHESDT